MPIAHLEQCSLYVHRDVQCCACGEIAIVQVPRMYPRRCAVDTPVGRRRRDAHTPEEWVKWNRDTRREQRAHMLTVERDDPSVALREIFAQKAGCRTESVVGP